MEKSPFSTRNAWLEELAAAAAAAAADDDDDDDTQLVELLDILSRISKRHPITSNE